MVVNFNSLDQYEVPQMTLCNPNSTYDDGCLSYVVGAIMDKDNEEIVFNFNSQSTLSMRCYLVDHDDPKQDAISKNVYYALENRRKIFVEDIGYFVITNTTKGNGKDNAPYKDIEASSCEVEIQGKAIPYIEDGTYDFTLLLQKIMNTVPRWSIGHVDGAVTARWRTFENVSTTQNCLAFMQNEMQNAYECIFLFDIINRQVNVYDQNEYVHLTSVHLTPEDVVDNLEDKLESSELYTALHVAGDDDITIGACNPNGSAVIYDFTYYLSWMTPALSSRVAEWQHLLNSIELDYQALHRRYYNQLSHGRTDNNNLLVLQKRLEIYQKCRDNIVKTSSTGILYETNETVVKYGGSTIEISDEIDETLDRIDELIAETKADIEEAQENIDGNADELADLQAQVLAMEGRYRIDTWFTEEELEELSDYIFEGSYNDQYVTTNDLMTDLEKFDVMMTLYERGKTQLQRVSTPSEVLTVDVQSFLFVKKFQKISSQLETGCLINVEIEPNNIAAMFLSTITVNYDDKDITLKFGNRYTRLDNKSLYEDAFGKITRTANSVSFVKSAVDRIVPDFNVVKEQMQTVRNLAMDNALNATNQQITIDNSGYTGAKTIDEDGNLDPRQVALVNNLLVFTDDGWKTAKIAIGEIPDKDGNPMTDADGNAIYGINAQYVYGDLIVGNGLIIYNNDGTELFTAIDGKISSSSTQIKEEIQDDMRETTETVRTLQADFDSFTVGFQSNVEQIVGQMDGDMFFTVIYDVLSDDDVVLHAHLYEKGKDVTKQKNPNDFSWYKRTEDGTVFLYTGYDTEVIQRSSMGYGGVIIGVYETHIDNVGLMDRNEDFITTRSGDKLLVRVPEDADGLMNVSNDETADDDTSNNSDDSGDSNDNASDSDTQTNTPDINTVDNG